MDFTVTNLNDSGVGSLRWAIGEANAQAGFDQILFDSSLSGGTITLSSDLTQIQDRVAINGLLSDSGKAGIGLDCNGHQGVVFASGAAESLISGVAIGNASGNGITLDTTQITIQNTLIGLGLDGITAMGNQGHGIFISERSHQNLIGSLDPLTGIPLSQQVSNVISANGGSGIHIDGGDSNVIANNRIGTSADGGLDLGNSGNGVTLANQSDNNNIGGPAHSGNDPTKGEFQRPGQGNLISGNGGSGVLIHEKSSNNRLMGNFIGTNASGIAAIANDDDGVAILEADNNGLIGTTRNESPFIYYNVVSGNGANGLRVRNSANITIHANFFGLGADNQTVVANGGDGALIEGNSNNIQYGGVIPLGNVNAGNQGNGINVTDQVSNFITFNTFAGLTAFGGIAPNLQNGIRISSNGGSNQVRTNVMAGNRIHGLHITGDARDVLVDPNIIGLNTYGTKANYVDNSGQTISWGNGGDGIRVDGNAEDIFIEGQRPSVIPQNTISNNNGYGIQVSGSARRVTIDNSFIGLSSSGKEGFGNQLGGIKVAADTHKINIGRANNRTNGNQVSYNLGNGIELDQTRGATVFNASTNNNHQNGIQLIGGYFNTLIGNSSSQNGSYGYFIWGTYGTREALNRGSGNNKGLFA